jgi:hypothetical protein
MRADATHKRRWLRSVRLFLVSVASLALLAALWVLAPIAWELLNGPTTSPLAETLRWAVFASSYKTKVLTSPQPPAGQLRHVEWDGWGWGGISTDVYLVFDPDDSLSAASQRKTTTKLPGVPCAVWNVQRMEPHWYSVRYYTDEQWDSCRN